MKKWLTLALCALFAATAAEAKTYYVNASRPNNNGNGLKPATAKKTIQAAINLSQDGDTILVYPGEYTPIKTNNKKITIKSVKGAAQTKIVKTAKQLDIALAQLGKVYTVTYSFTTGTFPSAPYSKGKNTTLAGFLLDGKNRDNGKYWLLGISGGTAKACSIQHLGKKGTLSEDTRAAANASLTQCTMIDNHGGLAENCVLSRCKLQNNASYGYAFYALDAWSSENVETGFGVVCKSSLRNCLLSGNRFQGTSFGVYFNASTLVNCTIAKNRVVHERADFSHKSKYYNCILRNNWRGSGKSVHNTDPDNSYSRTYKDNRDPKFVDEASGNCKLAKGSPCIDQGTVPAAVKSCVGTVDLDGTKRIRGKAIDMGCYEY